MTITWLETEQHQGAVCREFNFEHSGRIVPAVLWQPAKPVLDAPLVLFGHGASGTRHQAPIPWLARRLAAEAGFFCLSLDGPVHGRRKVGDGARGAFGEAMRQAETMPNMVADTLAVLSAVRTLPEVGSGPLGYWGLSMGTIFGLPIVAALSETKVAVLGLMGVIGQADMQQLIRDSASNITCPVLFIQQLEDELFSREQYIELFDAFASKDKRLHANPGLHPQVPAEELDFCVSFLRRYLAGEGRSRDLAAFSGAPNSISE